MSRTANQTNENTLAYPKEGSSGGIDKFEYYYGIALNGLLSNDTWQDYNDLADAAYEVAKASIRRLNQGG